MKKVLLLCLASFFLTTTLGFAASAPVDLNGDGKADFLWRYAPTGALAYWLMNGVTITAGGGITTLSMDWQLEATPDLNHDGRADMIWRHVPTGTIAYWIMSGTSIASSGTLASVDANWRIAGTPDLNGDGKPDVLWQHTPTGTIAVWYMNGFTMTSSAVITAVGMDWQIAGTPDLNSDGKPDILWRQISTGLLAYWLMDGITILSGGGIATVPSNWHLVGTPDLNGDGKPDFLWHDANTGTVSYWYMNGTSIAGGGAITTVPTSWDIVPAAPLAFDINYLMTLLLRGYWHFVYTIISVWTDDYSLTTMSSDTNSEGGYYISGTDEYGGLVNATYWPDDNDWSLLDPGTIIDKFYTLRTDGVNVMPGSCYYQIEVSTGNWSSCFPLSGSKTAFVSGSAAVATQDISVKTQRERIASEHVVFAPRDGILVDRYRQHKTSGAR